MKVLKWLAVQMAIAIISGLFAVIWIAMLFWIFEVESFIIWIAGAIAAAMLPLFSFLESLLLVLVRRQNRMGFLGCMFTAALLVVGTFLGGYFYLIGECVRCEPSMATFSFALLVFAIPAALAQTMLRRLFVKT